MKRPLAALAALSLLTGCVSQATLQNLNNAQADLVATQTMCAGGAITACYLVPAKSVAVGAAQQQVDAERDTSAALGLGLLAVGLGVAAAATEPCCYHHYHHRWR